MILWQRSGQSCISPRIVSSLFLLELLRCLPRAGKPLLRKRAVHGQKPYLHQSLATRRRLFGHDARHDRSDRQAGRLGDAGQRPRACSGCSSSWRSTSASSGAGRSPKALARRRQAAGADLLFVLPAPSGEGITAVVRLKEDGSDVLPAGRRPPATASSSRRKRRWTRALLGLARASVDVLRADVGRHEHPRAARRRRLSRRQPKSPAASRAAIAHITTPIRMSSTRQARLSAKTGASSAAP